MNQKKEISFSVRVARADFGFSERSPDLPKYLYLGCAEWEEFLEYCRQFEALRMVCMKTSSLVMRPSFRGMEIVRVMETNYLAVGL